MVRIWLHDLEPLNYLENLDHIDHCARFPRTQSQRTYVEGEILPPPPTQLMHAVVYSGAVIVSLPPRVSHACACRVYIHVCTHVRTSCLTTFAGRRSLRAPCHTQPRAEATRDVFKWIRDWNKAVGSGLFEPI